MRLSSFPGVLVAGKGVTFNQAFVNGPALLHQRHAATAQESNDKCEESQHSLGSLYGSWRSQDR